MSILRIGRYLMATSSKGIFFEPKIILLELWCDADLAEIGMLKQHTGKVQNKICGEIHWLSTDVGIKVADGNGVEHDRSRVHSSQ